MSLHVSRVRLKNALNLILSQLDLAYIVHDDVILVTTSFELRDQVKISDNPGNYYEVRVYNVQPLNLKNDQGNDLRKALIATTGG